MDAETKGSRVGLAIRCKDSDFFLCRIDTLSKALEDVDLSDEQKASMGVFLKEKRKIVQQGEMKEQHFLRMAELGFGNGGVVLRVEHKPTGIIMARKVSAWFLMVQCSI